jgi:UDP-glucose 4-epimerase
LANVYGPGQNPEGEAGIVSLFWGALSKGRAVTVFGDGRQTRDFVWVGDVVRAFQRALAAPAGTYNIGTGREASVLELLGLLETITGFAAAIRYQPPLQGEVRRNALGCDRALKQLGWAPNVRLEEGLKRTVRALRATCVEND